MQRDVDPPPEVVSEPQQRRDGIWVNGKARGADQECVDLMVFTVWQLNKSFTHQIKEKCPTKQHYRTINSNVVTGHDFRNLRGKNTTIIREVSVLLSVFLFVLLSVILFVLLSALLSVILSAILFDLLSVLLSAILFDLLSVLLSVILSVLPTPHHTSAWKTASVSGSRVRQLP